MESENHKQENQIKQETKEKNQMEIDEDSKDDLHQDPKSSKYLKRGRIFIRNLPFSVTEEKIRALFSKIGEIKELNLPYDNTKKMFKGFCFLQYETKREALKAITELNGKKLDWREMNITIAQPKNEYSGLPKIETDAEKFKNIRSKFLKEEKSEDKSKSIILSNNNAEAITIEKHAKKAAQSGNDPSRTLFIRNLGFNTTEDIVENLFSKYGKVRYCLICRNRDTNASKGSGFIMFENTDDMENVLKIFEKYETNKDFSGLNPFELDGRNLKLFRSVSKDEAVRTKEAKKNEDKGDNRNRELLYYGLNNYYDFVSKETEVSEEDKIKRENIIQNKKTNFKKNPNFHISETRLMLHNLDKTFDEAKIKDLLRQKTEKFMEELKSNQSSDFKVYMKVKKIKQIKLLRDEKVLDKDNNPKSKCSAYIEVCDKNYGKWLIKNLSNEKVSKNPQKGLIMDFSLDDIRKIRNRLIKLDKIKLKKREVEAQDGKSKSKKKDKKNKTDKKPKEANTGDLNLNEENGKASEEKEANVESIDTITDVSKLAEIYHKTLSRGKKQRIKKRLVALGHSRSVLGKAKELNFSQIDKKSVMNKNNFFNKSDSNNANQENGEDDVKKIESQKEFLKNLAKGIDTKNAETYTVVRVDNDNMNINKKIKEEIKKSKSKNIYKEERANLTGKKRERENNSVPKDKNKKFDKNVKNKNEKKEINNNNNKNNNDKRGIENKPRKNKINDDDDDDMDNYQMSDNINKIEENFKKKK
jgi:RNA recognition motif-containing protein